MDLKYDGCGLVSSVHRNQWLDFVNTVMNFLAPQNAGNLLNGLNQFVKMVPTLSCHHSRSNKQVLMKHFDVPGSHSIIHSVFCLTTGPKHPPKRFLHIVRSRASSFKLEYPLLSLRSSSSFLRFLPRLLVTSISPFIFPSITCFRRQFLRKM